MKAVAVTPGSATRFIATHGLFTSFRRSAKDSKAQPSKRSRQWPRGHDHGELDQDIVDDERRSE
jgi:hypothetical protein